MRLSANLGFLFRDRPLLDAIRAAHATGFGAVEMHWPYDEDPEGVRRILTELDMPLLCVNTPVGDVQQGEFGLSALPGRERDARAAIDRAVDWARAAGARDVHVMAGRTDDAAAFGTFVDNLTYAREKASPHGIGLLVEPLNGRDAPGYVLLDIETALRLRERCGEWLRIMFDCYHLQITHGDLLRTLQRHLEAVGHVQFAAVPDRAEPDHGEVDFQWLLPAIASSGYEGWLGAEYKPATGSFDWIGDLVR